MTRLGILVTSVAVGLFGLACKRDDQSVAEKLEAIDKKLASIDAKLAAGAGRAAPGGQRGKRQPPRGPNPASVYSVDINGAFYEGTKDAKVTVVEAFEFA